MVHFLDRNILQTLFLRAFDEVALKLGVFKVETIGDSYVAVAGLPERISDHAMVMSQFAFECLMTLSIVVKKLEVVLGPNTGELAMRFGLHVSGTNGSSYCGDSTPCSDKTIPVRCRHSRGPSR